MAETYCGKSCEGCKHKIDASCPGCKAGPGGVYGGNCDLARCVREKKLVTCESCHIRPNCGTFWNRENMADIRRKNTEAKEAKEAALTNRHLFLRKWLCLLFWMFIPTGIGTLLSNETVVEYFPAMKFPGLIISAISVLVYGLILIKLGKEDDSYHIAGFCAIFTGIINTASRMIPVVSEAIVLSLLMSAAAIVVNLVGKYNQYMAHSEVLTGVNDELSDKWNILWKCYISMVIGLFVGMIILGIIPWLAILGLPVVVVCAIGLFVVSILELVYLHRTAKSFRDDEEDGRPYL